MFCRHTKTTKTKKPKPTTTTPNKKKKKKKKGTAQTWTIITAFQIKSLKKKQCLNNNNHLFHFFFQLRFLDPQTNEMSNNNSMHAIPKQKKKQKRK